MEDTQLPEIIFYRELEHGKRLPDGQKRHYKDQLYALLKKMNLVHG